MALLSLALTDRINLLRAQKDAAEQRMTEQQLLANSLLEKAKADLERTVLEHTAELAKARDEAEHLASIDGLTGLSTRRYFEVVAAQEFARAKRYPQPLSVIIFYIDFLKRVNDTYGHAVGDNVLSVMANMTGETVREVDFVARIGGEEFVILLPCVTEESAIITAERLRERFAAQTLDVNGKVLGFTAGFGVTQLQENDPSFEVLL